MVITTRGPESVLPPGLSGLSGDEASARLAADGPNELPTAAPRTFLRQTWDVVRQPMLLLLLGAGSVNFALAEPLDGAVLMSFVVVVIAISIYQEHKTENALVALRDLSSPRALVMRDGRQQRVAGRDVVRDDVVLLAEGDRVPADAILFEAVNLSVDESALTGESVPVRKGAQRLAGSVEAGSGEAGSVEVGSGQAGPGQMGPPGGDDTPWVFSGTLVVAGHGIARVAAVGAGTELGRIGTALRSIEPERTRLQREIDRLVRVVALVGVGAAVVVVVVFGLTRGPWLTGLLAGIATAMATLPEEFPVILTVFLALGAWRMAQRNVLTRRPPVIETLGSVSALCVDKTGTLTLNTMTVTELIVDGVAYPVGDGPLPEAVHELAEFAVLAAPVDPFDPMDTAFARLGDHLDGTEHRHRDWTLVREYPLSPDLLALAHVWRSPDLDDYVVAAKGAPEAIIDLCHLGATRRSVVEAQVETATAGGRRVLAVARARFGSTESLPVHQHDFVFEYLGLAALHDPVRPGVVESVAECARAGVRVVMITGDYPGTARAIARDIGLDAATGACLTGPEVSALDDDTLAARAPDVTVFARVVPEQKLRIVRALQRAGDVVGMTGDGVNDAPALRAADVGIAMGGRGTDVARESAALVVTDDDFTSIVGGIHRGRGIYDNLRKAMAYVIAVHVPIVGMSLVPVFVPGWPLVLLPLQIAVLELVIDPACSVVFEAEQVDPRVMDRPPRPVDAPVFTRRVLTLALLQGVTVLAAVLAVYLWSVGSGRPDDVVRSITFVTLVLSNLALILVNRSWRLSVLGCLRERRNRTVPWILAGGTGMLTLVVGLPAARTAFGLGPVTLVDVLVALGAAAAGVAWFEVYKKVSQGERGRRGR